ncbi:DUF6252 family protein [Mariniflexile jejuense]|uniref:DUF6252 family protein n=1 Tax=Mariniflexile jejuense TaxID=1173582 RepID=A0ABW3JL38_9FLAO
MKFQKSIVLAVVLAFTCLITSCNIEPFNDDYQSIENNNKGLLKVDFDGKTFTSDATSATVLNDVINISGFRGVNQEAIILTIFASKIGTYQIGVTANQVETNAAAYSTNTKTGNGNVWIGATDFITSQGEVKITEIDTKNKTISGTFFFTGQNQNLGTKEFTNGVFSKISYTTEALPPSGKNTFFAKVDGVEFVEDAVQGVATSLPGFSTIGISATKNNLQTIGLTLNSDIVEGDYTFSSFTPPLGQYNLSLTNSNVSQNAGSKLTITLHDKAKKRIVGMFNFMASPVLGGQSYEITEGSFDVTYF